MKHLKTWITENIRPELKQPKNAAGLALVIVSFFLAMSVIVNDHPTETPLIIAAAAYISGMILILIPGHRNQDHTGTDEQTKQERSKENSKGHEQ